MHALFERSKVNRLEVEEIDAAELVRREPAVTGLGALFVPSTGIVDYRRITAALADLVRAAGGEIVLGAEVAAITETGDGVPSSGPAGTWTAGRLVVCGGLQADRLARLAGIDDRLPDRAVPRRVLPAAAGTKGLVRSLIYPIPDPDLPFLGVHLSPMIDGSPTVGPNAVLGFAREGYRKGSVHLRDVAHRHVPRLVSGGAGEHWRPAFGRCAIRCSNAATSRSAASTARVDLDDLAARRPASGPGGAARRHPGARFPLRASPAVVHVLNAPSPAATSALPIAEIVAERLLAA